jgi:hypothetical protein
MRWSLAIAVVGGCFYAPDSFHNFDPFPGKRVKLPCLDIAVTLTEDDRATSPVVQYSFGNRCTHGTIVDLGAVRATDGSGNELHAYDPRHELVPLSLDAWWGSTEEIMYVAESGPMPNVVCVDVGAAEKVAVPQAHWVCLGTSEPGVVP